MKLYSIQAFIILIFFYLLPVSGFAQSEKVVNSIDSVQLQELKNNARWAFSYGAKKEFDSANKYSKRGVVLANRLGNPDLIGYAKLNRALALYWQVKVPEAKLLLNENLENATINDSVRKESLMLLGEIGMYEKLYKTALPYMIEVEKIIRQNGIQSHRDSMEMSRLYRYIGNLHRETENFVKAHQYYDDALKYSARQDDASYIMHIKAGLYEEENKLQESIAVTKKALGIGIANNDHLYLPTYYLSLSTIYSKLKQPDSVIYFGKKGLEDNVDCQVDQLMAAVGNGYAMKQQYGKSAEYLESAIHRAVSKTTEVEMHRDLRDAYIGLKEYEKAFEHNKLYLKLKDSLDDLKVKQEVVAITEKYESSKKQLEIERLNSQGLKSAHVIKEQKSQLILTSLALLLAMAILGSILYFYIQQKKQKQLLYEKNVQLAKELRLKTNQTVQSNTVPLKTKPESANGIDLLQRNKLHESIEQLISDEFYLNREMSLSKMAKELETNTTYLSKIINEDYQKAFATFINELRLSHTLRNLESDPNYRKLTIEHIAYNSGFASSSTFYNAFKKFTGLTPSYYIKKRLLQEN